jgi:hypothetical protein
MISFSSALTRLYGLLNAGSALDLMFWTDAELSGYLGDALQRLSRAGLFIERAEYTSTVANEGNYALPANTLGVVRVSVSGSALRASGVQDLEALSLTWVTDTAAAPQRFAVDVNGLNTVRLYPTPTAGGGSLAVMYRSNVAATTHRAAACIEDYLLYAALGEARAKRSDGAMPDVVNVARERAALIASVCTEYWGTGNV